MTDKQELALTNFAQKIATARMIVALGKRMNYGESTSELRFRIRQVKQLQKLFDIEYGRDDFSMTTLQDVVNIINTLINDFRLQGTTVLLETDVLPIKPKQLTIIVAETATGEPTPQPTAPQTYFIRVLPSDIVNNQYVNPVMKGLGFTAVLTGGFSLAEGDNYIVLPDGGFELINDTTLGDTDYILVSLLTSTYVPPIIVEAEADSFPYLIPHLLS